MKINYVKHIGSSIIIIFWTLNIWAQSNPVIDVWYGDTQSFGQLGSPQKWVNILGNVTDSDGIKSLTYTLNGGLESTLSVGPNDRRLQNDGDFNIDILASDLNNGSNTIVIIATDNNNNTSTKSITLEYTSGNTWNSNYAVSWDTVTNIQNVVQVLDGKWQFNSEGIRIIEPGYDRLALIGDTTWTDYEITVPITVNSLSSPVGPVSGNIHAVGLLMRWTGHSDDPIAGWQPKVGWNPLGEIVWFTWDKETGANQSIDYWYGPQQDFNASIGVPYLFKVQVVTLIDQRHLYNVKAWQQGTTEPTNWNLSSVRNSDALDHGSLMLISHHIDATFGDLVIKPLNGDTFPIAAFSVSQGPANDAYTFDASSSYDPDGNIVNYSWNFGDGSIGTGVNPGHTYSSPGIFNVQLTVTDNDGFINVMNQEIIVADFSGSTIISDDFNTPNLNTDVWTFINPPGDGSYNISGYNSGDAILELKVTDVIEHDVWESGNDAVRIMQNSNDSDLQVVVKFKSKVTKEFQMQGVLIEEDAQNFIRSDFYSDGNDIHVFTATFDAGSATVISDEIINPVNQDSLCLRITRYGDEWKTAYSFNGIVWNISSSFNFTIDVSQVGVFAGNAGSNAPNFTAKIDYFFNTAAPIEPEDGLSGLPFASFESFVDMNNPLKIIFDATESYDPDGSIVLYEWDFGDSFTGYNQMVSHTYDSEGKFTVILKITDDIGNTTITTKDIEIVASNSIKSDDFNSENLNTDIWTFIDPKGDGAYLMDGFKTGQATISLILPEGVEHNVWENGNESIRLMQPASDIDFEIEVKFESTASEQFQSQGIIVEQDLENFIRFDIYSDGSNLKNFAATFTNGTPTSILDANISSQLEKPLFLRIKRNDNNWNMYYSFNGTDWENSSSFDFNLNVKSVGIFALNAGANPPSFTSEVDYFFNNESPITPEDGVELITGLNTQIPGKFKNVSFYPNPANNYIDIIYNELINKYYSITLFNGQGAVIDQIAPSNIIDNKLRLNTSDLSNGVYVLQSIFQKPKCASTIEFSKLVVHH